MRDLIGKILLMLLVVTLLVICVLEIGSVTRFAEPSKHGGKTFLLIFGLVYLFYTLLVIFLRPHTYGFVSLVGGVVIFDSLDLMTNLVFEHVVITSYFILWIIYFYISDLHKMTFTIGEFLILLFSLSAFISIANAENVHLATSYTFFTMTLFIFVVLSTSRIIRKAIKENLNIGKWIGSALICMTILSVFFFLYETAGRGANPIQLILINYSRQFTGNIFLTAGFMEPAGFSTFASILIAYFGGLIIYKNRRGKISSLLKDQSQWSWINLKQLHASFLAWFLLFYGVVLIVISGSRSGVFSLAIIMGLFVIMLRRMMKINLQLSLIHKFFIFIFIFAGAYIVIYRSANLLDLASSFSVQAGTSSMYLIETFSSFAYLFSNFEGTGAMNSNLLNSGNWSGEISAKNFINIFSNLFALGGTYGWISMLIYLVIIMLFYYSVKKIIKDQSFLQINKVILIISFAIVLSTILPLGNRIGPYTNWAPVFTANTIIESIYYQPKTYPVILGGLFIGTLSAVTKKLRRVKFTVPNSTKY